MAETIWNNSFLLNKSILFKANQQKGITLVALVMTIIIIIILATITMNFALGDN